METITAPAPPPGPSAPPGPQVTPAPDIPKSPNAALKAAPEPDDDPFSRFSPPPEKPKEGKDQPSDKPKEQPKDQPKDQPKQPEGAKDKPAEAPKDDKPPGRKTGWQMYHEEKKTTAELQRKIGELQKQISERPKAPEGFKIDESPEYKAASEKLTRAEKRLAELEDQIRFVDYEKSSEYQDKFHKPYVQAWQNGVNSFKALKVQLPDGQTRPGTAEDLQRIVTAPDIESATAAAEELFGNTAKASYALSLRDRIIDAHNAAQNAREEFRTKGAEKARLDAAEREKSGGERAAKFEQVSKEAWEKYPQWFKAEDGDERGAQLLEFGTMLADAAFGGQIKDPQTGEMREPTDDEMVLIHAQLRNKAAGFDHMVHKNQKLSKRIEELEAELAEYRETEPGPGEAGGKGKKEEDDDPFKKYEK